MPEATTTENTAPQEIGRTTSDEAEFEDIVPRPEAGFKRLQVGFQPKDQDDKWYFLAMGPDEAGNWVFHIIPFFSRLTFYTFHIKPVDGGGRYMIDSFSWEQKVAIPETEAEATAHAVALCRCYLECAFEALPYYIPRWCGLICASLRHCLWQVAT